MTEPCDELLHRLEDAERSVSGPPMGARERVWSAVEERLVVGPPPPELDPDPLLLEAVDGGAKAVSSKLLAGLVLIGAIVGGLALIDSEPEAPVARAERQIAPKGADVTRTSAPAMPASREASVAQSEGGALEQVSETAAAPEQESSPVPTPTPVAKPAKPVSSKKAPTPKTLADEVALMQSITAALKSGDSARVLELVAKHERDFAKGQFVEERYAAKARGLCRRGRLAAGRREAERFAQRWPNSIHLTAVHDDCAD